MNRVCRSGSFSIIEDGPYIEHHRKYGHDAEVATDIGNATAFEDEHPHDINEIRNRIETGNDLCPVGHTIDGCVEAAEQNENHHEEKGDEHGLLLCVGIGADEQAEAQHSHHVHGGKCIEQG